MIFWCLNNKTISNYKKSTYGSFMCMLFDAYEDLETAWLKSELKSLISAPDYKKHTAVYEKLKKGM